MRFTRLVLLSLVLGVLLFAPIVRADGLAADTLAPERATEELRREARRELDKVMSTTRDALVGIYVAFDPSATDPLSLAACDDDGDYVVVLSDAMLRLAATLARAPSRASDYARFVARTQVPGRRLVPPPAGFFATDADATGELRLLREMLAFLIARELSVFLGKDIVCPHPTATREIGDSEWTPEERLAARQRARAIYPEPLADARDAEAASHVNEAEHDIEGALVLLRFFDQLEREQASEASFVPTYLAYHPHCAHRLVALAGIVRAAEKPRTLASP
jgi:hypothetical protein